MSFKLKSYDICILDLLCDHKTGKLSTVKIWAHIANLIMSKAFLTKAASKNSFEWLDLAAYGAIVGGSYVAVQFLKWKFRDASPVAAQGDRPLGVE